MNLNGIANAATRLLGGSKLFLLKHAPELMTYGGTVVVIAGVVLACRASMALDEKMSAHDEALADIDEKKDSGELSEKEAKKAEFIENRDYVVELVKLYAPSVTTMIFGFTLILGGHHLISKRFSAVSAAYKALEKGYSEYRQRVRDDLGEEKDLEYLYGIKKEKMDIIATDENGLEKKVTADVTTEVSPTHSPYARFFDEFSNEWTRNAEYNLMFLNAQQNYANDKLRSRGHLFLNEVYEMLGLPHTQAGAVVGWVYDKKNTHEGDNIVDFGIYDVRNKMSRAFVNGCEQSILLDFNVDGVIYDLI